MYVRSSLVISLALLGVISLSRARAQDEPEVEAPTAVELNEFLKKKVGAGMSNLTVTLGGFLSSRSQAKSNFMYSPLNIYIALALVLQGSSGDTEDELAEVLGIPIPSQAPNLTETSHNIIGNVVKSVQTSNEKVTVRVAAELFIKNGTQVNEEYQNQLKTIYGSEAVSVDFETGPATDTVNAWISNQTNGRIPKLFSEEIPKDTALLLANVLYFSGTWKDKFSKRSTQTENFTIAAEEVVDVNMMSNLKNVPYYDNTPQGYRVMGLHFAGNEQYTMYFILPTEGVTLSNIRIKAEDIPIIVNASSENTTFVNYKVPKTKFSWNQEISHEIKDLGAKKIFDKPDFSKIVDDDRIKVSQVRHAAEIEIHEDGCVATAATTITFTLKSAMLPWGEPVKFVLDRPFAFFIYHHNTSSVLFYGNVYNPNG